MTSALEGGEWSAARPGRNLPPVPIVQEAGWAPGPVWTGAENLAPTGIRSPDRPARSHSLYRLSYPAQTFMYRSVPGIANFLYERSHNVTELEGRHTILQLTENSAITRPIDLCFIKLFLMARQL
jgi:hypothetical protein